MKSCHLRITQSLYAQLLQHLFPGDNDEHGAVLIAGLVESNERVTLLVREVHFAREGTDYIPSKIGHRALSASFIHKHITACRDRRLVYLAVHNHLSTDQVAFSHIDMESHERGYPALRDIASGMPVGALVLGTNSVQADVWMPSGERLDLTDTVVVGPTVRRIYPKPPNRLSNTALAHDRQIRLFGKQGQGLLASSTIAVIGLGGVGSLVSEYLSRLGVGELILVDPDIVDETNLSRVVGATLADVNGKVFKVEIAKRVAKLASPNPKTTTIASDIAKQSIAAQLRRCDFMFLAADSMRARLVFNALVHQYLIPGTQLGAKATQTAGDLQAWSAIRQVRPGEGCLWCNGLIDAHQLAIEAKSDEERLQQAYGINEPNPSVITLNAVAAAHGVNEFLFDYLSIREPREHAQYFHLSSVGNHGGRVLPRASADCSECSNAKGSRFALGDAGMLPTTD